MANTAANLLPPKNGSPLTIQQRQLPGKVVMTILLLGFAFLMVVPFIWMVSSSFKFERDVMSIPIRWLPENPTWDNYKIVLHIDTAKKDYHFLLAYWNSIKVSVLTTIVSLTTAATAGYAFAKLRFRGANVLFIIYLAQMMVPSQLTLIPRFVMFSALELTNNHISIIAPSIMADSRRSLGTLIKAWRIIKVAETAMSLGAMMEKWVLVISRAENMTNRGIKVSWEGTIIWAR